MNVPMCSQCQLDTGGNHEWNCPFNRNNFSNEMKSQCCNAKIEIVEGGIGVFALTTGAYICSKCRKYCVRKQI